MCNEITSIYTNTINTNIFELLIHEDYICHYLIPLCDQQTYITLNTEDYIKETLKDKPEYIRKDDFIDQLHLKISQEKENSNTYKILQISDWHVDLRYQEGTSKICR